MVRFWKKLAVFLVILGQILPISVGAVSTSATASALVDVDSGRVLYSQNGDKQMRIASTTKLLTALVALRYGHLHDVVTVSKEAAYTEGSSMYLKVGEQVWLETLLYGLLLNSGNDAAVAIAQHIGGSVAGFADLMNQLAQELGMANSSFANPNGLDAEGHYSTALDMAKLGCAAVENPTLVRIASTKSITMEGRTMTNHNRLLDELPGCIGLKTGYTQAAGRTLVSCVERNGQRLVAVTLQDGNDWADHKALYDYGFANFPAHALVRQGQAVAQKPMGASGSATLVAAASFVYPLQPGEAVTMRIQGETATFTLGEETLGEVALVNYANLG